MDAKAYLEQIDKIDRMIRNKFIECRQWQQMASSTSRSSESVKSSSGQQKVADAVIKIITIEEETNALVDRLADTKKEVIGVIEQLSADCYDILHKRYIQGMTVNEIAYETNKSVTSITRKLAKGISEVQKIIDKTN